MDADKSKISGGAEEALITPTKGIIQISRINNIPTNCHKFSRTLDIFLPKKNVNTARGVYTVSVSYADVLRPKRKIGEQCKASYTQSNCWQGIVC